MASETIMSVDLGHVKIELNRSLFHDTILLFHPKFVHNAQLDSARESTYSLNITPHCLPKKKKFPNNLLVAIDYELYQTYKGQSNFCRITVHPWRNSHFTGIK